MRVVHVARTHRWDDTRIYRKECRSLVEAGHEVYIVTSDRSGKSEEEICNGVKFIILNTYKGNKGLALIKYLRDVERKLRELNADVYHIHEFFLLCLAKRLSSIGKVVFDSHEDFPKQVFFSSRLSDAANHRREKIARFFLNHNIVYCDAVIGATDAILDTFQESGKYLEVIYNYPDLTEFDMDNKREKREERKQICYIGGISEDRGIKKTIEAVKELNVQLNENIKFVLAGPITNSFKKELEEMEGWHYTNYLGYANSQEKKKVYENSAFGMVTLMPVPRYIVALPVKMFEYMAAGLPIIASNFSIIKDIVEKEQCGICVDPTNVLEIAEAMNFLLENRRQANMMGHNGRNAVLNRYNWKCEERKLLKLYETIENERNVEKEGTEAT